MSRENTQFPQVATKWHEDFGDEPGCEEQFQERREYEAAEEMRKKSKSTKLRRVK